MPFVEAAETLKLSPDALRIRRGTSKSEKGDTGRWYIWVNTTEQKAEQEVMRSGERSPVHRKGVIT
jgi:hypothetical protein